MKKSTPKTAHVDLYVDGAVLRFECEDDIIEAFDATKKVLMKHNEKPKESKRRGSRFLLAILNSGIMKDPGNKVRKYCEKILS